MIQSRIDHSIPKLRPYVDNVWRTLHVPVSLGNTTCLRIVPDGLTQARPTLVNRVLSARLSATGALSVEDPCQKPEEAIRVYTEGLKIYQYQHNLLYNRGITYANQKKYKEAISDYKQAIQGKVYHGNSHLPHGLFAAN